jgi:hypothetical protein
MEKEINKFYHLNNNEIKAYKFILWKHWINDQYKQIKIWIDFNKKMINRKKKENKKKES